MRRGFRAVAWILLAMAVLAVAVIVPVGALCAHDTEEFNRWVGLATVAAVPLTAGGLILMFWDKITASLARLTRSDSVGTVGQMGTVNLGPVELRQFGPMRILPIVPFPAEILKKMKPFQSKEEAIRFEESLEGLFLNDPFFSSRYGGRNLIVCEFDRLIEGLFERFLHMPWQASSTWLAMNMSFSRSMTASLYLKALGVCLISEDRFGQPINVIPVDLK